MSASTTPPVRIAVDIGGTFTDLQIYDERTRSLVSLKTPTTPEDPSLGLLTGIKEAAAKGGFTLADVGYLLHGTTIATNAVLERKLARGALVTTARFEDVAEIGRHYRREVYALNPKAPPSLIPRDRRLGIKERTRSDGSIDIPVMAEALDALVAKLDALDVQAVAVCLINAYRNAENEQRIGEHLAKVRPRLAVSCSSALNGEIREFERTSTTILNALLMPVIDSYLGKLDRRMKEEGLKPHLFLVQSNGGVCSPEKAGQEPVRLLLSGPSGGSAACALLGKLLNEPNLVGVDMGGTSFDVSVVRDGKVNLVTQGEIDGLPVRLPMVEINTIGAGGGSIAKVRAGGRLTVGPESAGSRPGPACYGRGGTEPAVTDANIALARLDGEGFLGGGMRLDRDAATKAIATHVGGPLKLGVEAAAEGILAVTNASLGAAIRLSLFEKGLDPRDFVMVAFGGAAGLHAVAVADEVGIRRVVFPESASTLSAFGILHSNLTHDLVRSQLLQATSADLPQLAEMAKSLLAEGKARLDTDAVRPEDQVIELAADMRYKGQAFELTVTAPPPAKGKPPFDQTTLDALIEGFHALHEQRFSYANRGSPVEIVTLRASAIGKLAQPEPKTLQRFTQAPQPKTSRKIFLAGAWTDVPVWNRDDLGATPIIGPAVVEEAYTTVLLEAGWTCHRLATGHLIAERTA
ncbi:MAG: hydantoinase/oxoprolinase family protein [Hyphomicrobiales bacterium]|nr:MAG: hydantoinase/oxoprolinase family protein [Hyphomicrobiales bacterium]